MRLRTNLYATILRATHCKRLILGLPRRPTARVLTRAEPIAIALAVTPLVITNVQYITVEKFVEVPTLSEKVVYEDKVVEEIVEVSVERIVGKIVEVPF